MISITAYIYCNLGTLYAVAICYNNGCSVPSDVVIRSELCWLWRV